MKLEDVEKSSEGERDTTGKQIASEVRRLYWPVYSYIGEEYGAIAVTDPFATKTIQL